MAHKILAVDPRFKNAARQTYMKQFLAPGFEIAFPASFEREEILRMIVTGTAESHAQREPKAAAV